MRRFHPRYCSVPSATLARGSGSKEQPTAIDGKIHQRLPIVIQYVVPAGLPPMGIYSPSISRTAAAEHWNVDPKLLEERGYLKSTNYVEDPREDFLLCKGIQPIERDLKKHDDFQPTHASRFALLKGNFFSPWPEARRSLAEIMELPYSSFDRTTESQTIPDEVSFDSFVDMLPMWGKDEKGVFVFFRDHPKMTQNPLIQRATEGPGTLVACAVLQHYLVALANDGVAPTLDIACWLRKHAPSTVLENHIFRPLAEDYTFSREPLTVDPMDVLPLILKEDESSIVVDENPSFEAIPDVLRRYGPVLLDRWDAHYEVCRKTGEELLSYGSSVLVVGFRTVDSTIDGCENEESNEGPESNTRLLIQRWWPKGATRVDPIMDSPYDFLDSRAKFIAQFMEVSAHDFLLRLVNRKGRVIYVKNPQPCIPLEFDTTHAIYSKCSIHACKQSYYGQYDN